MPDRFLSPPLPSPNGHRQSGIADPIWPARPPKSLGQGDLAAYDKQYAGQIDKQRHLHLVLADVTATSARELKAVLRALTKYATHQATKAPPPLRELDPPPANRRVSVTIGFGASLFTTVHGDDRFGLAALRPRSLKVMPSFAGDDPGFSPAREATDLIIQIASDDFYVNEYLFGLLYYGNVHARIAVRRVERGYARPDSREPSGFEDGSTNPKNCAHDLELDRFVFVRKADPEPDWCVDGTYLAYRKVRRRMGAFFKKTMAEREAIFGVDKDSGDRHDEPPHDSHAFKMNPRRDDPDFMGIIDTSRRFLRRPYFFNDGLDAQGLELRGIHHISFVRDLVSQYEWPVLMWQTNKDFNDGPGMDALYARGGAANIGGGYYFVPPAARSSSDYIGSGMF